MDALLYDVVAFTAFVALLVSALRTVNLTAALAVVSFLAAGVVAMVQSGQRSWLVLAVAVFALAAQVVLDHVWPRNGREAELEPVSSHDGTLEPEVAR